MFLKRTQQNKFLDYGRRTACQSSWLHQCHVHFLTGNSSLLVSEPKAHVLQNLLSFSMWGMTVFPLFTYEALNPSMDRMMSGGRTNLHVHGRSFLNAWNQTCSTKFNPLPSCCFTAKISTYPAGHSGALISSQSSCSHEVSPEGTWWEINMSFCYACMEKWEPVVGCHIFSQTAWFLNVLLLEYFLCILFFSPPVNLKTLTILNRWIYQLTPERKKRLMYKAPISSLSLTKSFWSKINLADNTGPRILNAVLFTLFKISCTLASLNLNRLNHRNKHK